MNLAALGQYPIPSSLENGGGGALPPGLVAADPSSWMRSQIGFLNMPFPQTTSNGNFPLAQANQQRLMAPQPGMSPQQQQHLAQTNLQFQQSIEPVPPVDGAPVMAGLTYRPPILMFMECDRETLSEYQCLVRQQIEIFEAEMDSIKGKAQGRNTPILLGQVGIRCKHCAVLPLSFFGSTERSSLFLLIGEWDLSGSSKHGRSPLIQSMPPDSR